MMSEHEKTITVKNKLGLHARAAAKLVKVAGEHEVHIEIGRPELMVNAKSIMGVLMLAAAQGTELQLKVKGENDSTCIAALDAITELFDNLFGEGE